MIIIIVVFSIIYYYYYFILIGIYSTVCYSASVCFDFLHTLQQTKKPRLAKSSTSSHLLLRGPLIPCGSLWVLVSRPVVSRQSSQAAIVLYSGTVGILYSVHQRSTLPMLVQRTCPQPNDRVERNRRMERKTSHEIQKVTEFPTSSRLGWLGSHLSAPFSLVERLGLARS